MILQKLTEMLYGNRPTLAPPHGGADPSSGSGAGGATPAELAAYRAQQHAFLAAQQNAGAQQNALAGLGNMGAPGLGIAQFAQAAIFQSLGVNMAYAKPPPPLETAGITVGELVGWRIWRVRPADRLLMSFSADRIWLPGEPMEGKPSDHGSEGIWVFKDAGRAAAKLQELGCESAIGTVWLWGNVIEHADGYRGEFAEVRSLEGVHRGGLNHAMLTALRQRYRVGSAEDAERADREAVRTNENGAGRE